ncbi:AI-2E family transporter [Tetragenococcus osmophilus]|uniref:AI-2E family transporter n=1 Tax=Tetragenococcus osmophilus TaxID=526944 RepID=A0AA37XIP5_9ENTE|nr:AI-2E family transporter [Tetragenococcus osmophilus]AYW48672.1 AI-2E family transporter [Tetragenococcus osmophilus]GMA71548.1 AI-2E family transporter [Tetragenococcus osmophilus]
MQKIKIDWNYWFTRFLFVMAIIIGFKLITNYQVISDSLANLLNVLSPFIIGFIFAYLLNGAQKRLENLFQKTQISFITKHSRGISVLILYLIIFYLFFLVLNYVVPLMIDNLVDLLGLLPQFYNYLMGLITRLEYEGVFESLNLEEFLQNLTADFSPENLLQQWTQALTSLGVITKSLSSFVLNSFLTLIISVYALLFKDGILSFIDKLGQKTLSEKIYLSSKKWMSKTHTIFYKFISSRFLDACVIGVLASVILYALDVPFALTLGILTGVCNMIPYFGSIFASIVTTIITFFSADFQLALTALISLLILQQIDGNIIGPRIMGGALDLNPIIIIISITVGGAYFGVLGMFLAVPIAAILKIIMMNWLDELEGNELQE